MFKFLSKLSFRSFAIIAGVTVGWITFLDLIDDFHLRPKRSIYVFFDMISVALEVFLVLSIIIALKRYHEKLWRSVPFYLIIIDKVVFFLGIQFIFADFKSGQILQFYYSLTGFYMVVLVYLTINSFQIKNKAIAFYGKIYAFTLLLTLILVIIIARSGLYYRFGGYRFQYIQQTVAITPGLIILMFHLGLYSHYERLSPGKWVMTNKNLENLPAGCKGSILKSYPDLNVFDVEFAENGNVASNIHTIAKSDLKHCEPDDLETRVEKFGGHII